jgi:hypothetical protein
MTDCNEVARPVHSRMPVLLHVEDYDRWLRGSLEDVIAFQNRCFPDESPPSSAPRIRGGGESRMRLDRKG